MSVRPTILSFMPVWLRDDVEWLSTTRGLLGNSPQSLKLIKHTSLQILSGEIEFEPSVLSSLTEKHVTPLGRYFEALVQAVVSLSPDVERTFSNVVVMDGKRTAGEFDLLYEYHGCWVHLELAVKYYIGVGDLNDSFNWHGPALRDTLGRKLVKLFDHQLKLPSTVAGQVLLSDLNISYVQSEALLLGRLFHSKSNWQDTEIGIPETVAADHPRGWWGHIDEIIDNIADPELSWMILDKLNWLSPVSMPSEDEMVGAEIVKILEAKLERGPVMLAAFYKGKEFNRGFVVPDTWKPLH